MICAQCEFSCSCLRAEVPVQMADITLNSSSQRVTGSLLCFSGAAEDEFLCFSISSFVLVGLKIKSLQLCGINKQHRWSIFRNSLDHSRINSRCAPRITSAFLCRAGFSNEAEWFRSGGGKGIKSGVPKGSEVVRLHPERRKNRHMTGGSIKSTVQSKDTKSLCFHSGVSVDDKSAFMLEHAFLSKNRIEKTCDTTLNPAGVSTTWRNSKLISYWKFRLQITDLNVHPVGSETDQFPLLGGIKYAILFCGKGLFNCSPRIAAHCHSGHQLQAERGCAINEISH